MEHGRRTSGGTQVQKMTFPVDIGYSVFINIHVRVMYYISGDDSSGGPLWQSRRFGGSEGQLILTLLRNTKSKLADVFMA